MHHLPTTPGLYVAAGLACWFAGCLFFLAAGITTWTTARRNRRQP